nr:extensin family protein [Affinibrenneria salicis]
MTAALLWARLHLPPQYNPFAPLAVTDPPTLATRYKLKRLSGDPAACLAALQRARDAGFVSFSEASPTGGDCPLTAPVRIRQFGDVQLSSSFLSSCAMALSSTMFVIQAKRVAAHSPLNSPLARIDHLGSYACRNIYHRAEGRLSEHATADAWDIAAFRLQNGERLSVLNNWRQPAEKAALLRQFFQSGCGYFGNALGPDYNAAHANHFHFGMRGFGLCR